MGCVLRVRGDEFDIDNLLSILKLTPCHVQRKGHRRFGPKSRVAEYTGFNVSTSDASEDDLQCQISDTISFIERNIADLQTLMSYPGVRGAELGFSIRSRLRQPNVWAQNDYLPPKILLLAGQLGLAINLTQYSEYSDADERRDTDQSTSN